MAKSAVPEASRLNAFAIEPERLTIVTDEKHHLYDERIKLPLDENLVRSIMVHGVKLPVMVTKEGDKYLVVDGRQRVRAAIEANGRLEKEGAAPVKIKLMLERGIDADLFGVVILANEMRQGDDPMTKAKKAKRLLDMDPDEQKCAITFGISQAQLQRWLKLLDLDPKVQKAVERGDISSSAAVGLAELPRDQQVEQLDNLKADEAAGGGKATVAAVQRAAKKAKGGETQYPRPSLRDIRKVRAYSGIADEDKALLGWILGEVSAQDAGLTDHLKEEKAPVVLVHKAKKGKKA